MLERYMILNRAIRAVGAAAREWLEAEMYEREGFATGAVASLLIRVISDLEHIWPKELDKDLLKDLKRLVKKGDYGCYREIIDAALPKIEDAVDTYFSSQPLADITTSILDLLHPAVVAASHTSFRAGRYRDAVFNAQLAVFDLLRQRTGLDKDGADLVGMSLSLADPYLVLSSLETDSGRNEQKGYIQILQGAYLGIRNPKAHSLQVEADQQAAAQHMVFASLLCRRIEGATLIKKTV